MKSGKYLIKIGEDKLKLWLLDNYDLKVKTILPINKGEIGDNYIIENYDNKKYFLKIHLQSKLHIDNPNGLGDVLKLIFQIHSAGIENVASPLKLKNNELEGELGEYSIIVINYVEGKNLELTSEIVKKCAEAIAKIHQIKSEDINLPIEPFDTKYANKLLDQLNIIEKDKNLNGHLKYLGELILPQRSKLEKHLYQLDKLCDEINKKEYTLVITHGDLISDNIMVDKNGNVIIVDWDSAKLSLPERDAWFFMQEFGEDFVETYRAGNPLQVLDINSLSFFMYKRYLEDLVYWVDQILIENLSDDQIKSNLNGIEISCLRKLDDIEKKINNMQKIILQ